MKYNKNNFHEMTIGVFKEIGNVNLGKDFRIDSLEIINFLENKFKNESWKVIYETTVYGSSKYYSNAAETKLVRVSDHWGAGIRSCSWFLKSRKVSKKDFKIGIINFNKLQKNNLAFARELKLKYENINLN